MSSNKLDSLDKKGILKVIIAALTVSILGIVILGWQYNQLEKKRLPALEEKIEQQSAQNILERFLETGSDLLLTERAAEQKQKEEFFIEKGFGKYEILKIDKLADQNYRFLVKIGDFIEIITLIKISDRYYIDSVETAG